MLRPSEHSLAWKSFEIARRHALFYILAYNYHLHHLIDPQDQELTKSTQWHRTIMASTRVFRGRPSCFQDIINLAQIQQAESSGDYWPLELNRSAFAEALDDSGRSVVELRHSKSLGISTPIVAATLSCIVLWASHADLNATEIARVTANSLAVLVLGLSVITFSSRLAAREALLLYQRSLFRCFRAAANWTLSAEHVEELSGCGYSFLWYVQCYWLIQESCMMIPVRFLLFWPVSMARQIKQASHKTRYR